MKSNSFDLGRGGDAMYAMVTNRRWGLVALGLFSVLVMAAPAAAQCPTRCVGGEDNGLLCSAPGQCTSGVCSARPSCVHLEFRPASITAAPGSIVEVGLYAVSSNAFNQGIQSVEAILTWLPTRLQLLSNVDPCNNPDACFICPANQYNWFSSIFPNDCNLDGLNAPCPGFPANDGNAWYQSLSQIFCSEGTPPAAFATPAGLHVTTLRFQVTGTAGTGATVAMNPTAGDFTYTRVLGSEQPGTIVTGNLGPAFQVNIQNCLAPTVASEGSRYLKITPPAGTSPVALRVSGVSGDPQVACFSKYVQANGTLGDTAVYRTPAEWGTVAARGAGIVPSKQYNVQTDCGAVAGQVLSSPVSRTTWKWGDVNNDSVVDIIDITRVVDAFRNVFHITGAPCTTDAQCTSFPPFQSCITALGFCRTASIETTDLTNPEAPCTVDRVIDISDISRVVGAFQNIPFSVAPGCPMPCP